MFAQTFITIGIAIVGGLIGLKLKIPAGAIVGALLLTGLYNIVTGMATMPTYTSLFTQVGTGAFVGAQVGREDVVRLRKMLLPAGLALGMIMACSVTMGFTMTIVSDLDLVTAMFSCATGGILEMSLICDELGGNATFTALFQTLRVVIVVSFIPSMIAYALRKLPKQDNSQVTVVKTVASLGKPIRYVAVTMTIALLAGFIGRSMGIPAGAMVFSMVAVALLNIFTPYSYVPLQLRRFIQYFGGATIGAGITLDGVMVIVRYPQMVLLLTAMLLIMNLLTSFILVRFFGWDLPTAMFGMAPGGVSDMAMISGEFGANVVTVAFLQVIRLASVIAIYPIIIATLIRLP